MLDGIDEKCQKDVLEYFIIVCFSTKDITTNKNVNSAHIGGNILKWALNKFADESVILNFLFYDTQSHLIKQYVYSFVKVKVFAKKWFSLRLALRK